MYKSTMSGAVVFALAFVLPGVLFAAAKDTQTVTISDKVAVPGAELSAGSYVFSVEDRLPDRAIVRIASAEGDKHFLLLAVPSAKLTRSGGDGVNYFTNSKDHSKAALKAWSCASCTAPLEFVYPKLEAVKITDESTEPVLAVDPSYDKLPSNLSSDDMKVVTLWLLSPERITAENVGEGVKAVKYTPAAATAEPVQTAANSTPASEPTASAMPSPRPHRDRLPKTASNNYLIGLCGFLSLGAALSLRFHRLRTSAA